mmetsp:Transcript_135060/g.269522  ORF Transcript_135060/g.269522 Transcript_135060/m.269522 type:complete len:586 (-) Transcript_135060:65-1822(-)|eukprot:CAMPEP_0172837716 /NCGR_PEP_ID=MMETSP1075-20121228/27398_1 /TAXON_ID=2916 /ORGANISM="Ceratium fusus, Strain PA161109" /LENGTH=585 /DNA_ID=CAMNT_0013681147 /DNA_START=52 /DNA_END=1809 /DNA_ORIENTATION=-
MIHYDPGTWGILFAFRIKGSVFPKSLVWAAPCSVTSVILHIIIADNPAIFHQVGAGDVGASVLTGFTFILGFLVVFRSQQAYSRWWEGGTLLQQLRGEWFNAYSCLLAFCNASPEKSEEVLVFQHRLARLCSLLYFTAIQQVSTMKEKNYELLDLDDFDKDSMEYLLDAPDGCEICLQWIQRLISEADEKKILKVAPPILSRVYNQLGNGIVNLNNARKITEFPIPFPLAQMITFMLLFHWLITAFICAASVEQTFWAGILSFIVTFSFWSIHYIAVELEQPFGDDTNDLPLHEMQIDMNDSLLALLDTRARFAPAFRFKKERHVSVRRSKQLIEEIEFTQSEQVNESETTPAAAELADGNHVTLPQEVCAAQTVAPPQFATKTPPARNHVPMVAPTTCWSAGTAAATGAATSLKAMTSRTSTSPETRSKRVAQGDLASALPNDIQGSSMASGVKHADALHGAAPPDIGADLAISTSKPPNRIRRRQETSLALYPWEKQCGTPSQSMLTSSVLSAGGSKVRHFGSGRFHGIGSRAILVPAADSAIQQCGNTRDVSKFCTSACAATTAVAGQQQQTCSEHMVKSHT